MQGNDMCFNCANCANNGACAASLQACQNDTMPMHCNDILMCVYGCQGDPNCIGNCVKNNSKGQALWNTYSTCFCGQCGTPCGC
jgi:hypothetical protein